MAKQVKIHPLPLSLIAGTLLVKFGAVLIRIVPYLPSEEISYTNCRWISPI